MQIKSNREWQDPAGGWHEAGTEETLDQVVVFDYQTLIEIGTVEVLPDAPVVPPVEEES